MKRLMQLATLAAVAAVIWEEAKKPLEERNWHGRALGFLPYDCRVPTLGRLREAYWNPQSDALVTERPMGIGWAVNFGVLARYAGLVHPDRVETDIPRAA